MLRWLLVLCAVCTGVAMAQTTPDPTFPPGGRIGLVPPPGMTASHGFSGFEDSDRKAAISLVELPLTAYEQVELSIFEKTPPGFVAEKREMLPFADGVGFLLVGRITIDGTVMHRWYLLGRAIAGRNTDFAAFVTVNVPDATLSQSSCNGCGSGPPATCASSASFPPATGTSISTASAPCVTASRRART